MKMQSLKNGLIALCLMTFSGCAVQPSPAPAPLQTTCPVVIPCRLSPVTLDNHRDLLNALTTTETDWANCAAQIDSIVTCQQRDDHGQTDQPETAPD